MTSQAPGRRKTGPKPGFDLNDAVECAIAQGLDRFTLTKVARDLGVTTPGLYRVINSREDLLMHCLLKAAESVSLPSPDSGWQDQIRQYAAQANIVCRRYPGMAQTLMTFPGAHFAIQHYWDDLVKGLAQGGFPGDEEDIYFIINLVTNTCLTHDIYTHAVRDTDGTQRAKERLTSIDEKNSSQANSAIDFDRTADEHLYRRIEFLISAVASGCNPCDSSDLPVFYSTMQEIVHKAEQEASAARQLAAHSVGRRRSQQSYHAYANATQFA